MPSLSFFCFFFTSCMRFNSAVRYTTVFGMMTFASGSKASSTSTTSTQRQSVGGRFDEVAAAWGWEKVRDELYRTADGSVDLERDGKHAHTHTHRHTDTRGTAPYCTLLHPTAPSLLHLTAPYCTLLHPSLRLCCIKHKGAIRCNKVQ